MSKSDFVKFAAIDIGSNAIRLLFANSIKTNGKVIIKKESLIRVPLRLGEDAFLKGAISEKNIVNLSKAMVAFKNLMEISDVLKYRAYATAALREATNGKAVVERVFKESGVQIKIIDGVNEAKSIFANHSEEGLDNSKNYLYIDVGGGSTELSLFSKSKLIKSESFPVGTIKILNKKIKDDDWKAMKKFAQDISGEYKQIAAIGTGGNINKIYKLFGDSGKNMISYTQINKARNTIDKYSYDERVALLGLKPDRADVIIPASEIFLSVMKWADIKTVYVPKIGLVDGIIHQLTEEHFPESK